VVVEETHRAYLQKFLERVPVRGKLLSAACGAGRFDGMLLKAGHPWSALTSQQGC
jgi:hypothetical protein